MLARLAGLAVLIPAAAVGLTAQLIAVPVAYLGFDLPQWYVAPLYDWDAQPAFAPVAREAAA
jgi:hypothetical protein